MAIDLQAVDPLKLAEICESKFRGEPVPASGSDFGNVLSEAMNGAKGEKTGTTGKNAASLAEIVRLEMMRSSLAIGSKDNESATSGINDKVALILKYLDEYRREAPVSQALPEESGSVNLSEVKMQGPLGLDSIIDKASRKYGVDGALIRAVIKAESNFNSKAVSNAGAQGLMQLMPSTARGLGVADSFDPEQNVMGGTRFLKQMLDRYDGNLKQALAAYNWGPGNVDKKGAHMPRETSEYMTKVIGYYNEYST